MDTRQVPGVATGGAGHAGGVGISPALGRIEEAVLEASELEQSQVTIRDN